MKFKQWLTGKESGVKPVLDPRHGTKFIAMPDGKVFYATNPDENYHWVLWNDVALPYAKQKFPQMADKQLEQDYALRGILRDYGRGREVYFFTSKNNVNYLPKVLDTMTKDGYISNNSYVRTVNTIGDKTIPVGKYLKNVPTEGPNMTDEERARKTTMDQVKSQLGGDSKYQQWQKQMQDKQPTLNQNLGLPHMPMPPFAQKFTDYLMRRRK